MFVLRDSKLVKQKIVLKRCLSSSIDELVAKATEEVVG